MILTTLISIAAAMKNKNTLTFANVYEANFSFDAFVAGVDFPAILVIPPEINDKRGESSVLSTVVPLELFFLNRYEQATVEAIDAKVEAELMQAMLAMGREFLYLLNIDPIIDASQDLGIENMNWKPVYNWGDVNAYGYTTKIDVPIMEGISGYVK